MNNLSAWRTVGTYKILFLFRQVYLLCHKLYHPFDDLIKRHRVHTCCYKWKLVKKKMQCKSSSSMPKIFGVTCFMDKGYEILNLCCCPHLLDFWYTNKHNLVSKYSVPAHLPWSNFSHRVGIIIFSLNFTCFPMMKCI